METATYIRREEVAVALEREIEVFRQALPALLHEAANRGQFALVGGDAPAVAGVYPTFDAALAAGYERFGLAPFLVKEVTDREEPRYFSRSLRCPT